MFHATAAEALSSVQGEVEELSVAAEGEYRYDAPNIKTQCTSSQPLYVLQEVS